MLADKVSGTLAGLWLLVPEHLRLGTWELLQGWTGRPPSSVEPRLALQLIHEAALCMTGIRQGRALSQRGFELVNGLPFLATDQAIHDLLDAHTVQQAQALQVALGKLRRASGHYRGALVAIDPHVLRSYTKRETLRRKSGPDSHGAELSPRQWIRELREFLQIFLITHVTTLRCWPPL